MSEGPIPPVLEVRQLSRRFPGVLALDHVNFDILRGEVHALVGENGAGKSTLINILAGVLQSSAGQVLVNGQPVAFADPLSSQRSGISVIFQEFNLLPHLSVAENVFVTREPRRGPFIDWETMNQNTRHILQTLNVDIDPTTAVGDLAVSQQQLVEIARALASSPSLLLLDEPTAGMNPLESAALTQFMRQLRDDLDLTILLIEHDMKVVMGVSERIVFPTDNNRADNAALVLAHGDHIQSFTKHTVGSF